MELGKVCFVFIIARNNVFIVQSDCALSPDPTTDTVSDVTIILLCERTQFDADAHRHTEISTTISQMERAMEPCY